MTPNITMRLMFTYLNALYTGRYQHTNEHGVNAAKYTRAIANVTPDSFPKLLLVSTMRYAMHPITFTNKTAT